MVMGLGSQNKCGWGGDEQEKISIKWEGVGALCLLPFLLRPWCHCKCINMTHTLARENVGEKCIHLEKFEFLCSQPPKIFKHQHQLIRTPVISAFVGKYYLSRFREIMREFETFDTYIHKKWEFSYFNFLRTIWFISLLERSIFIPKNFCSRERCCQGYVVLLFCIDVTFLRYINNKKYIFKKNQYTYRLRVSVLIITMTVLFF